VATINPQANRKDDLLPPCEPLKNSQMPDAVTGKVKKGTFALAYPLSRQRETGIADTHAKKGPLPWAHDSPGTRPVTAFVQTALPDAQRAPRPAPTPQPERASGKAFIRTYRDLKKSARPPYAHSFLGG
jgi:hypothetical protein